MLLVVQWDVVLTGIRVKATRSPFALTSLPTGR